MVLKTRRLPGYQSIWPGCDGTPTTNEIVTEAILLAFEEYLQPSVVQHSDKHPSSSVVKYTKNKRSRKKKTFNKPSWSGQPIHSTFQETSFE